MDATTNDGKAAAIAAAIGEPARARMLFALLDGRARTSTELAVIAGVTPSTASVHLGRMAGLELVRVVAQGKHRYYRLSGPKVAGVLESLGVLAGGERARFEPNTPHDLRAARTCYDHLAGALGVVIHDRLRTLRWISPRAKSPAAYEVTRTGEDALVELGVDVGAARSRRRRFAYACLDWSERRPHLGGALGAAVLDAAVARRWIERDLDSRIVRLTARGRRDLALHLGVDLRSDERAAG